jgi:hypothetical protein
MRPTVDEQLDGVLRLLDAVVRDEDLSARGRDRLRDAERLVRRVRGTWSTALPFLVADNTALEGLLRELGADLAAAPEHGADVAAVAVRNEQLRERLSATIRVLPRPPHGDDARARIGAYLQHRVAADPT